MKTTAVWLLAVVALATRQTGAQKLLFAPAPDSPIAVAGAPGNVAIADLNDDKRPEIVVARGSDPSVTVLLGQGDGRFRLGPTISLPNPPGEMALGDINADARFDLALAHHDSYGVMLLFGDGKGGFALTPGSPFVMREGQHPHTHGLGLGDLNGDGKLDLATANNEDNDISVSLGDGRGGFAIAAGSPFAVARSPYPLTLADLDADGDLDIISTSTGFGPNSTDKPAPRELTILWGDGRGSFKRSAAALCTEKSWYAAAGDINGDRRPDIVATHAERNELTVLLGNSRGGFSEVGNSPFDLGHAAWSIALADVNRDGWLDAIAAAGYDVRVLLGDGKGGFKPAPGSPYASGKGAWRMAVGDLNRDGKVDIATSDLESDTVSVLLAK
jgi:hypothetical protein